MGLFDKITAKNFNAFAQKHYDDPQCEDIEDFNEDLRRFRYLKRLLRRYYKNGELRERLILNHLIVIFNIFGFDNSVKMLEFKIDDEYWPVLKTCLIYMNYVKEDWKTKIPVDMEVAQVLRDL